MSTTKKFFKNTLFLTISEIIHIIIGLFVVIYIARTLGAKDLGIYSFLFSLIGMLMVFSDLGLSSYSLRELSKDKSKTSKYINNILSMRIVLSIITFIILMFVLFILDRTNIWLYGAILGSSLIIDSYINALIMVFRSNELMKYEAIISITRRIIYAISILALYFFGALNLINIFIANLIISIVCMIFAFIITRRYFFKPSLEFDFKLWRVLLTTSIPFGIKWFFSVVYFRIDIVILSALKGDYIVGIYAAAYKFLDYLIVLSNIYQNSALPVFARLYVSNKQKLKYFFEKSVKLFILIGIPIAIGTTLLADKIINLVYGTAFSESVLLLQILIWAILFFFIQHNLSNLLSTIDYQKYVAKIIGINVFVNIGLNFILIPKYGALGCALTTVICEMILLLFLYIKLHKTEYRLSIHKIAFAPLISGLIMGITIFLLKDHLSLLLTIIISGIIYCFGLLVLKGVSKEEIHLLINIFKKSGTK